MKAIIALFIFSFFSLIFLGCGSSVQYTMQKGNTNISGDLSAYSTAELNAITKQLSVLSVLNDTSLSASDKALQLSYLTDMKDLDVQIIEQRGGYGYNNYAGSRQQNRDMEIDAIARLQRVPRK
jgi:hypothetical protein